MSEALILDCIQKDPDHRPSAEEAHERLLDAAARADRPTRRIQAPLISVEPLKKIEHTRPYSSEAPTEKPPLGGAWREGARGWRKRGPILLAAALLLALLSVAAYATVLGGNTGVEQASQEENQQTSPPENAEDQYAESAGGGQDQTPTESTQEDTDAAGGAGGEPSKEAAERTVRDFYQAAVDKDFGRHSGLMTPSWRQANFPEQDRFENTYATLKGLEFVEGPTAEVSDNTATVTGVTIARHTDRTERNRGTWTLVYQNGEWRIDGWQVVNINTGPPQT